MGDNTAKKILIVDSDEHAAGELSAFFKGRNYSVQTALQYQAAMTSIQSWKPDLVVLNILLHRFNPLEFLAAVKNNPFTETQKIIIFSKNPKMDVVTGPSPEVKGYLTKPIDSADLSHLLEQLLRLDHPETG